MKCSLVQSDCFIWDGSADIFQNKGALNVNLHQFITNLRKTGDNRAQIIPKFQYFFSRVFFWSFERAVTTSLPNQMKQSSQKKRIFAKMSRDVWLEKGFEFLSDPIRYLSKKIILMF